MIICNGIPKSGGHLLVKCVELLGVPWKQAALDGTDPRGECCVWGHWTRNTEDNDYPMPDGKHILIIRHPRNTLIYNFILWVEHFQPRFFVMENVPGILSMGKGKVVEKVINMYQERGYSCRMETLLAAEYGVPQLRKRVFFIGTKDDSVSSLKIPKSHRETTKQKTLFEEDALPAYLTVGDAISDVLDVAPKTIEGSDNNAIDYNQDPITPYQEYLRQGSDALYDHIAPTHTDLVVERISHIRQGKNHASLPEKYKLKGGYPNIYGRLHLNRPTDTITGNCGCVSAPGRFIHPTRNGAISVREAARFQSFPDHYRFLGTLSDRYSQVGNAVPPLLAFVVAKALNKVIK